MPTGPDDGTAVFNDGRVGTAFIQEYRFNKYCQRLQNLMVNPLDAEFKMFLKKKGIELDTSTFKLGFLPPQSFSEYREIEINNARAAVFGQLSEVQYLSRRFVMKKYLGLTDEEILENESMWMEENPDASTNLPPVETPGGELSSELNSIGVERPTEDDMGQLGALAQDAAAPPEDTGQVNTGAASPLGSAPAPGAPQA
jgi:hypothetical protein